MQTYITNKEIWQIATPIMLGNLAQTIITFTDTAFLGHLGTIELSASMMAGLFYFVFTTLAMGFAVGVQIFIARRFGERRYDNIGEVFQHGAVFVLMLGVLLFGIMFVFGNALLDFIIESDSIYNSSIEYLKFRQYGIFFVVFNYLFRSFYVGISNTKSITYSTLLMASVNVIFDYCLIFGSLGLPKMGVSGAAIASLLAEFTAFSFFTLYTKITVSDDFEVFKCHKIESSLMWRIIKVAFPSMLQRLLSFGTWFLFFVLIEKMGEMAIGVSSVVRSTYMILIIPVFAFAATANTLTSRLIGEGKSVEVRSLLWKVVRNSFLSASLLVLLTAIFPVFVLRIYTTDAALITHAIPAIFVVCIATLISSVAMMFFEAVSGTGRTSAALTLEFGVLILYVLHIYILAHNMVDIHWVWTAEWVYNILIGIISWIYIAKADWQSKRI